MRARMLATVAVLGVSLISASSVFAQAQPAPPQPARAPSVTPAVSVDPGDAGATPHWTITLGAPYCGGYRIGDGVYVSPEAPLALPQTLSDGSVLYSGQPASIDWVNGALRVNPAPGLLQSMICMPGDRPLTIELLPQAGFSLPGDPGDYTVDVWTGAAPNPINLTVSVPDPTAEQALTDPSADEAPLPGSD